MANSKKSINSQELRSKNKDYQQLLKKATDELKKERDTMSSIVNSMGEGLIVIDNNFRIMLINSVAEKLFGVSKDKAIGEKWSEFLTAYRGEKEIPYDSRTSMVVVRQGKTIRTELEADHYYLTKKSGKKFPVVSVTAPIKRDGKVIGAVKVFRDATVEKEAKKIIEEEMKRRASELKEEKVKSRSVLENIGEGIVVTDENEKVTYVNPAFNNMTGYSQKDLEGKDFISETTTLDFHDKSIPEERRRKAIDKEKEQELKFLFESKDKNRKIAIVGNVAPISVDGVFRGIVRVFHDYTEDLELQRQKDDFFSIAAHELRTPLSIVSGNLDNVLSGYGKSKMTEEAVKLLEDSEEATDRLIHMVDNFLNVSRLEQGRIKMTIEKIDVCKEVAEMVDDLSSLAKQRGIKLRYECNLEEGIIKADKELVRRILTNLIGNSIKFTEKGNVKVTHEIEGNMLVTRVQDTGIGIAKDKQKFLFQRFQQAMTSTLSREAGGVGLGLFISREFARLMKGDLILEESDFGKGSTFSFTLPLA